ncbi:MAG: hypothetical protein PQJ44_04485 [Sphaerochaetaceae bacterium]|nr:hypothetical protein [Sphaerochaetaceae bacterium]
MKKNTSKEEDELSRYLSVMREIKNRELVIIGMNTGKCNAMFKIVNLEVMFFQLRKILELIVKVPMIIHEKEYRSITKYPEKDWKIYEIMAKLKKINPEYYPQPIKIIKKDNEPDEFQNKTSGFLTEEQLVSAYKKCNNYLHALNPLSSEEKIDFEKEMIFIKEILFLIHELLGPHIATPKKDGCFFYIGMKHPEHGNPHGNFFVDMK